jgi:hypothetical protein
LFSPPSFWCLSLIINIHHLLAFHAEFEVRKQLFYCQKISYQLIIVI